MYVCKDCIDDVLEATRDWLQQGYEGGVIGRTSTHWDHEERRDCPAFMFHWGVEDMADADEDE